MLSLFASSDVALHPKLLAVVVCSTLFLRSSSTDESTAIVVYAIADETVQLPCPLPRLATPRIEWFDLVYNTDPRPKRIFSTGGRRKGVEPNHPNSANYRVDANFTLFIRNVKLEDAGTYNCSSRQEQNTLYQAYYLAVSGHPLCNGTKLMHVGQTGHYSCESEFSGNYQPQLDWYREPDSYWESVDRFEVRLAKKAFDLNASEDDDGTTFTCLLTFGDVTKECSVNLTVLYPVRDLVIDPIKESFTVDEEIRCSANGSPTPEISFEPALDPGRTGFGWRSVTIPKTLNGKKVTVECVATNLVDGRVEAVRKSISFSVEDKVGGDSETEDGGKKGQSTQSRASSSSGAIVGGIVVGITILVIIVAVVFWVRLRKDKKPTKEENGGAKTQPSTRDETQTTRVKENEV